MFKVGGMKEGEYGQNKLYEILQGLIQTYYLIKEVS